MMTDEVPMFPPGGQWDEVAAAVAARGIKSGKGAGAVISEGKDPSAGLQGQACQGKKRCKEGGVAAAIKKRSGKKSKRASK